MRAHYAHERESSTFTRSRCLARATRVALVSATPSRSTSWTRPTAPTASPSR